MFPSVSLCWLTQCAHYNCRHGYLSGVRCSFVYSPADTTGTHYLLLHLIQIGFTFLLLAHRGTTTTVSGSGISWAICDAYSLRSPAVFCIAVICRCVSRQSDNTGWQFTVPPNASLCMTHWIRRSRPNRRRQQFACWLEEMYVFDTAKPALRKRCPATVGHLR